MQNTLLHYRIGSVFIMAKNGAGRKAERDDSRVVSCYDSGKAENQRKIIVIRIYPILTVLNDK